MASDIHFLSRNNAFEAERRVTLTLDGVLRIVTSGGETAIPVSQMGLIELSAGHSIASGVSYTCQIYKKRAWFPAITIKSKRYRGPNDFADQRTGYRQLMTALHAQIVTNAWPIRTQIAARPSALLWGIFSDAHWALLIWVAAFLVVLLGLAWLDPPWASAIPEVSFAIASAAALGYLALKSAAARDDFGPWPYDPRDIPKSLLPEPLGGV